MHILVIGSGTREYALLYAMSKDPQVADLHVAPGNAGTNEIAAVHPLVMDDPASAVVLAKEIGADLVVIDPEVPLVVGVADALRDAGFAVSGPNADTTRIERFETFAKDVMKAVGVKTASAEAIQSEASDGDIEAAIDHFGPNWVVKDSGLVAGKGVVAIRDRAKTFEHVKAVSVAGNLVLLESFLDGPEVSLFCLVDGETVIPLLPAQGHERVGNNDGGPNTGGTRAYSPLSWLSEGVTEHIATRVCEPVAREMVVRGCPFQGLLYAGLTQDESGPAVIEFNCRFGDPETQAALALLESPVVQLLNTAVTGALVDFDPLSWRDGYTLTAVLAAEGYPVSTRMGDITEGVELGYEADDILRTGTTYNAAGELVFTGGHVSDVTDVGDTLEEARDKAYETIKAVKLEDSHYHIDIALPTVKGHISIQIILE